LGKVARLIRNNRRLIRFIRLHRVVL
jgi:hypothetical protein